MTTIPAMQGPTAVQCNDSTCAGKTFTCSGPYLCELDCIGAQSCQGTTLVCGTSPCRLVCDMMSCGGTIIECGSNYCDTTYWPPPPDAGVPDPVSQLNCGTTCPCTKEPQH
jgi:hypothetical protein